MVPGLCDGGIDVFVSETLRPTCVALPIQQMLESACFFAGKSGDRGDSPRERFHGGKLTAAPKRRFAARVDGFPTTVERLAKQRDGGLAGCKISKTPNEFVCRLLNLTPFY